MNLYLICDDVILYCIFPYLNLKDIHSLSFIDKLFHKNVKIYKNILNLKPIDIYNYFICKILYNIKNNLFMLDDCYLHNIERRYLTYTKYIEDGIYYYCKSFHYQEFLSFFDTHPYINLHSHNIYVIILIHGKTIKTHIITKTYNKIIEKHLDYMVLKYNDAIIKLY